MKQSFRFALMLALLAAPAFAGQKSQNVNIPENVVVGTTQVVAGDYKLTYTGTGPDVQVTLSQLKKAPITFTAKTVAGKFTPSVQTETQGKVVSLQSIQLKDINLVLDSAPHSGQ
jgi:hypothetical protein